MKPDDTLPTNQRVRRDDQTKREQAAALDDLRRLFSQYERVVERAKGDAESAEQMQDASWPLEAEALLEAVEAYLRTCRMASLAEEPVTRDDQTGFFLDTTDRCWNLVR